MKRNSPAPQGAGQQRLSMEKLQAWEALKFGMFICFGMSTFDGDEFSRGDKPSSLYAPDKLDVDQWVSLARDAGMKYAILTCKHVSGHCLWPTRYNDYHVGTSGNKTDVVRAFVESCEKRGVLPALYYCAWDNYNRFGSQTPTDRQAWPEDHMVDARFWWTACYTTPAYHDFMMHQMEELLTQYGRIMEVWIDIPGILPRAFRNTLYGQIPRWQPEAVMVMNNGLSDASTKYPHEYAWPSDIIVLERHIPHSGTGYSKWRGIEGKNYYMPGESCDVMGHDWFYRADDAPRSDRELLGMYLSSTERGVNFVLNVGPDPHGLIPKNFADSLLRLGKNIGRLGG